MNSHDSSDDIIFTLHKYNYYYLKYIIMKCIEEVDNSTLMTIDHRHNYNDVYMPV